MPLRRYRARVLCVQDFPQMQLHHQVLGQVRLGSHQGAQPKEQPGLQRQAALMLPWTVSLKHTAESVTGTDRIDLTEPSTTQV